MNFDAPTVEKKPEGRSPLYAERPSEGIEDLIQELVRLEKGEGEKIELSAPEKETLLQHENLLGETLEKIYEISPREATLFAEYFLTAEGQNSWEQIFGRALQSEGHTLADVEKLLKERASDLGKLSGKELGTLIARSRDHSEDNLFNALSTKASTSGSLDVAAASPPHRVTLLLTPEKNLQKISALEQFRDQIKKYRELPIGETSALQKAFDGMLALYQSRVNELLVEAKLKIYTLQEVSKTGLDDDASTPEQNLLARKFSGTAFPEKNLARYDKFLYGASREYASNGERQQISAGLAALAEEFEKEFYESESIRTEQVRSAGLDPEKIFAPSAVPPETIAKYAAATLAHYGLLSADPVAEFSSDRTGPASDDKWQFVMRDTYKTMAIDGQRKAITCGTGSQPFSTFIPITLGHEIEGHVLQHENRRRVPLRLFQRVGSGRNVIFAECGAMQNQDAVSREAFGYPSPPHPHYIRAMQKKFEGGSYLDCVQAFYESAMKGSSKEKALGRMSQEEFQKRSDKNLKLAINRSRRLFREGSSLTRSDTHLTSSKDTAYLEQLQLFRSLKKRGLEKYAFIGGSNLQSLAYLLKTGFLDPDLIQKPRGFALQVWDEMKEHLRDKNSQ